MPTVADRVAAILRDAANPPEPPHRPFWSVTLIPIHICLGRDDLSGEELDDELQRLQAEGIIAELVIAAGEPHDDDDVYYIKLSAAGEAWLGLNR